MTRKHVCHAYKCLEAIPVLRLSSEQVPGSARYPSQRVLRRPERHLGAVPQVELGQNIRDMSIDSPLADDQLFGDTSVGISTPEQRGYFPLPGG